MTIQQAAHELLTEFGHPMRSQEIARIALERGMVSSNARDPVHSLAQTIEKNIRDVLYNEPQLEFLNSAQGRLIQLPGWSDEGDSGSKSRPTRQAELRVLLSSELIEQLQLASQAKIRQSFAETVAYLLERGLATSRDEIRQRLMHKLEALEKVGV